MTINTFISGDLLLAGQSNAQGDTYGDTGAAPTSTLEGSDVEVWHPVTAGGSFVQAQVGDSAGTNGYIGLFGGCIARAMLDNGGADNGLDRVRFVTGTQSASGIYVFSPKNVGGIYDATVTKVRNANFSPGAIVWWQGESDTGVAANLIENNLNNLLCSVHHTTGANAGWLADFPTVRRIVCVVPIRGVSGGDISGVQAALRLFAKAHPQLVRLVDISDLRDGGASGYESAASPPHMTYLGYRTAALRVVEALRG